MRAIGYVRVSTEEQANDGVSLDAQRERIAAWCSVNGHELVACHVDGGLSGARTDNRPGLKAALDEICRDKGVLVVYSLSRLARSTKETLAISESLDRAGADLTSLTERIDTTSAAGKMVFRMLAVLAEFERDLVFERTAAALRFKIKNGQRAGEVPFGYHLASDGKRLHANEAEQCVITEMRELRSTGQSYRRIAAELNARGRATKKSRGAWSHSSVRSILARATI